MHGDPAEGNDVSGVFVAVDCAHDAIAAAIE
jgi:hypothetical protein